MLQTADKADASTCYVSSVVFARNFQKCEGHYTANLPTKQITEEDITPLPALTY